MALHRNALAIAGKRLVSSEIGRSLLRKALGTALGRAVAFAGLVVQPPMVLRVAVRRLVGLMTPDAQRRFTAQAARRATGWPNSVYEDIYWLALANPATMEEAWEELRDPQAMPTARGVLGTTGRIYARAIAAFELARYKDAVESFRVIRARDPEELKLNNDYLKAAFSAGKLRDKDLALEFFACQYLDITARKYQPAEIFISAILRRIRHDTIATLAPHLALSADEKEAKHIGVFYLSSTEALGHAILDPYYFLALYRHNYDRIFFIGPSLESYRPASRVCVDVVEQHGDYLHTSSDSLLNLSWMSLGTLKHGPLDIRERGCDPGTGLEWHDPAKQVTVEVDMVVEHYWSLLREAVHRSLDPDDSFQHNAWHLKLPDALNRFGENICKQAGLELDRPLVVLHARDQRYHNIGKQSYRDADINNYVPAIEHLLAAGYQVVRVGDSGMSRLRLKHPDYHELPFLAGYDHRLDPFLISRAAFMIGCQSGPCAYARAFGVPLLSVNAVLHYTLLPSTMEMACFKRYYRLDESGEPIEELDIEQALVAGVSHFDNSYQFRQARIGLRDAAPDEILAAIKDMIAWLAEPERPETVHQKSFREAVARHATDLKQKGDSLDLPIADFLGISLPGYRISPTVAAMRAKKPAARAAEARAKDRAAAE